MYDVLVRFGNVAALLPQYCHIIFQKVCDVTTMNMQPGPSHDTLRRFRGPHIKFRIGKKTLAGVVLTGLTGLMFSFANAAWQGTAAFLAVLLFASVLEIVCGPRTAKVLNIFWTAITPLVVFFLIQHMILGADNLWLFQNLSSIKILLITLNVACCAVPLCAALICTSNYRASVLLEISLLLLFAAIDYFVISFRGSELSPADFLSIETALQVAGEYRFQISVSFAYAMAFGATYCFIGYCIPAAPLRRTLFKFLSGILVCILLIAYITLKSANTRPLLFEKEGSIYNGCILNFTLRCRDSRISKPEGYEAEAIKSLEEKYKSDTSSSQAEKRPTVIVIMNESFSDLSVLGSQFQTSEEATPFFDSLQENTIRGYALASVFGGTTANSEYEFLSGNSMGFLPYGSVVYPQFINGHKSYTIMSFLKDLGYSCYAMHPESPRNWVRKSTYPLLGFDNSYFQEAFPYKNLLRSHVSDQEMYEELISLYEEKVKDEELFLFGITMQNHGGYFTENFPAEIKLEGYSQEYPDVEQYLTLLQYSDRALQYLLEYFSRVNDDVVILFFGDHMPGLSDDFYYETCGGDYTTLDEQMRQYIVPFAVWANYDIEEKYIPCTSLNFLSNYLFEAMGITPPVYNEFLSDVSKIVPAMNSMGYYSLNRGMFVPYDEAAGVEAEILHQYRILQYNCLFDNDRSSVFFPEHSAEE